MIEPETLGDVIRMLSHNGSADEVTIPEEGVCAGGHSPQHLAQRFQAQFLSEGNKYAYVAHLL